MAGTQKNHTVTSKSNSTKPVKNYNDSAPMSDAEKKAFTKALNKIWADSRAKAKTESDRQKSEAKLPKYMRGEKYKNWNPK